MMIRKGMLRGMAMGFRRWGCGNKKNMKVMMKLMIIEFQIVIEKL